MEKNCKFLKSEVSHKSCVSIVSCSVLEINEIILMTINN